MQTLEFDKKTILDALVVNRAKHQETHEAAMVAYRKDVLKQLGVFRKAVKSGKPFKSAIEFEEPISYVSSYDLVISMLQHCQDQLIKLSSQEYQQYMMDDWLWKANFTMSNSKYLNS